MPDYPQLVNLSVPELIGAAGGDPWQIDDTIQAGTPGEISELAQSFYNAGNSVTQTSDEFNAAKKRFDAAWDRDDSAHPINDAAELQRATQVMHVNREAMTRIGVDLQHIAASLAEAQRSGHISISGLNGRLVQIDNTITAEIQKAKADGVQLDWSALKTAAIGEVKSRLAEMNAVRTAYGNQLNTSRVEMAAEGYDLTNGAVPQTNRQPANLDDALNQIAGGGVPANIPPTPAGPPVDPKPVGQPADLNDALDQIAGAPVPAAAKPVPMDPKAVEEFKAMVRPELLRDGVPPDRVEAQLNAMVARAAQGVNPFYRAPEPPKQPTPGFGEGFADRWFSTEQSIDNLLGQGGPGAPGVLESWGEVVQGTAENVVNPFGAVVDEIQNAANAPSAAYYFGEKAVDAGATAVTLPWGGEGAAVRAGLPVRTLVEGGAPEALLRAWDPTGGMPRDAFEAQFGTPTAPIWPENDGFPPGYQPQPADIGPGTVVDRFGYERGSYFAPDLTPFADRSLGPESAGKPYGRYEVTDVSLPPGWQWQGGPIAPWFGQTPTPGTPQYFVVDENGVKVSTRRLKEMEVLVDYGPVLGFEIP
jgi:hypothetical protein